MLKQLIGLNVHGLNYHNHNGLLRYVTNERPQSMLVMNNPQLAEEISGMGVPHTIYRHRFQRDEDIHVLARTGYEWWNTTKQEIKTRLGGRNLDRRVIVNVGNELHGDYNRINKILTEAVDAMAQDGYSGVYGNFAVGLPEPSTWYNELAPLVDQLSGAYRDMHFLGLHEYMMQHPFLGIAGYSWNGLTVVDNTPTTPMHKRIKYIMGRYEHATRATAFGRSMRILVTEFGADYVPALARQFNFPDSMRGWKSQFVSQQHMMTMYKLAITNLYTNPNICGIMIFSFGNSGGWDLYNIEDADWFLNNVSQLKIDRPEKTKMTEVEIKATGVVNVRSGPSTNFPDIGDVPQQWTRVLILNQQTIGGFTWKEYRFDNEFAGWVRSDVIEERPVQPTGNVYIQLRGVEIDLATLTENEKALAVQILEGVGASISNFAQEIKDNA